VAKEPKQLTEYKESLEGLLTLFSSYAESRTKHQEDLWRVHKMMTQANESYKETKEIWDSITSYQTDDQQLKTILDSLITANGIKEMFSQEPVKDFGGYTLSQVEENATRPKQQESTRAVQVKSDDKKDALKYAFDHIKTGKEWKSTIIFSTANEYLKRESKADGNFYTPEMMKECGWIQTGKKDGTAKLYKKGTCKWKA